MIARDPTKIHGIIHAGNKMRDRHLETLHDQIARFAKDLPGGEAQVEIELRDGSVLPLESILPEPGFGFVTLRPHSPATEEIVIPIGAIARLQLRPPEQHPPFGFSKPAAP